MQKNSNSDYDGYSTDTASLQIGKKGVDLRQSIDQDSLTALVNARFSDSTTIERRKGHTASQLQSGFDFPIGQAELTKTWLYGHGNVILGGTPGISHITPIVTQNQCTFNYLGNDVSWTGDRLLIHDVNSPTQLGTSNYWNPGLSNRLPIGIPCYLPSLVDHLPPVKVIASGPTNTTYDIASGGKYRCILYATDVNSTVAQIISSDTGGLVSMTTLNTGTSHNANHRVLYSAGKFVAYWTDIVTGQLYTSSWSGATWTAQASVVTAGAYDVFMPTMGNTYILVYRVGPVVKARQYIGSTVISSSFASDKTVVTSGATPSGPVGVSMASNGNIGIAWYTSTNVFAQEFSSTLNVIPGAANASRVIGPAVGAGGSDAIGITSKPFDTGGAGFLQWTTFVSYASGIGGGTASGVIVSTFSGAAVGTNTLFTKFHCVLASRAFTVGNEVFAWMRSGNFPVYFLVAGGVPPIVCGYADRGEATVNLALGGVPRTLSSVAQDPSSQYKFTWARGVTATSDSINHLRYSTIDFLPQITAAQYGNSVYLSGSAVANFDGYECSDAGFHDFPLVTAGIPSGTGGSLSAGAYSIRAYVVRYNNKGERFVSSALTSPTVTAAATNIITWTVRPVTSCTSQDAFIEFYRTLAGGTTYFLESVVSNTQATDNIAYISTKSDTALSTAVGDPYQVQLGGLSELLENGPIGCTTLISYNDRMWSCGGQIQPGRLQFSKLKIDTFGAGYSALIGGVILDAEFGTINSIAGMNDAIVAFESSKVFVLEGDGPDNFGRGSFPAARFAAAKGATTHFGTILTDYGLVYWNEGGPHLLTGQFQVQNISDPVRPLAITITPTGVRINPQQQEVIWYTSGGISLLWDYKAGNRWATWTGLFITAASTTALSTTTGQLFVPNDNIYNDGGQPYVYSARTSHLRADGLLEGYTILKRYGLVGTYEGEHTLDLRVYYNGSPLWEESEVWSPEADTYLQPASAFGALTAAQVDALTILDKSGNYAVHRRAKRQNCQRFQLEFLDNAPDGPSFSPQSLEFELGSKPGFGRSPVTTFTDK